MASRCAAEECGKTSIKTQADKLQYVHSFA